MNKFALCALTAGMLAAAAPAFAGGRYYAGDRADRWEPRDRDTEYADVVSARPIYQEVRINQPRQECWDERVAYRDEPRYQQNNQGAGTVIGAVIGGVLGHQVGHGGGRAVATAAGAVIGAGVGNDVGRRSDDRYYSQYSGQEHVGYEQRCRTVDDVHTEQRVQGYDVAYRYGGRVYHTTTEYDPGSRIPVDVNVRPVGY